MSFKLLISLVFATLLTAGAVLAHVKAPQPVAAHTIHSRN